MTIGLRKSELEAIMKRSIPSSYPSKETAEIAKAIATAISKNNEKLAQDLEDFRKSLQR